MAAKIEFCTSDPCFSARSRCAALIRCWIGHHEVARKLLRRCSALSEFLDSADALETSQAEAVLTQSHTALSIKDVEYGFESLIGADQRRSHGVVYTPDCVSDYLVTHAASVNETMHAGSMRHEIGRTATFCDPACGSGGFLLRATDYLARRHSRSHARVLRDYVVGIDRDAEAIGYARCLLELFLAARNQHVASNDLRIFQADTLLDEPERLWQRAGFDNGFDVVCTNPPYVKLQNLPNEYRQQLLSRYPEFAKGSFSLALLFLIAGHRLLSPGGCLGYVTQNNFFTSLAGEAVRRYLQQSQTVRRIVDFGHARVFPNASAYACLVFAGTQSAGQFDFASLHVTPTKQRLAEATFSQLSWDALDPAKWRLAAEPHFSHLARLEAVGDPLGSMADIRVGFATLKDAVFQAAGDENRCWATAPDGRPFEIEPAATRRAVKVAALRDEQELATHGGRVIFPYHRVEGRWQLIPETEFQCRFPCAYRHLLACRDLLDRRDKGRANVAAWYAWGRAQGRDAPGPKLLTKTFDSRPNFLLDRSDQLFCNGYAVSLKASSLAAGTWTLEALQRVLNSKWMYYYAKLTSFQIRGGFQCYQKNFIERFTVPRFSACEISRFVALSNDDVDRFLAAKYEVPLADVDAIVGQ